jgi:LPXTG-motif cell wall-anchored protein
MQAQDAKYKKWGWGALIGLGAVIVIAGLVVAVTMSAPKKTTEADKANGPSSSNIADNTNKDDKKDEGREDNEQDDGSDQSGADGTDGTDGSNGANGGNNSNNSNNSSNTNTNNGSKLPKTGPEEDIASIMAWAAIAGLGAYYFLNAKKNA